MSFVWRLYIHTHIIHIYIYICVDICNIFIHIYQTLRWLLCNILFVSPVCSRRPLQWRHVLRNVRLPSNVAEQGQKDYFSSEHVESELAKHHLEWLTCDIGGWYVCLRNGYDFGQSHLALQPDAWNQNTATSFRSRNIHRLHRLFLPDIIGEETKNASIRVGFWWLFLRLFGEFPQHPAL